MAQPYVYTVYRGTFIQALRVSESVPRPRTELVRNRGALWVSSADGRIKGFDWQAHDDQSFRDLMARMNWVDADASTTNGYHETEAKVKIVTACEDRNEFFFPGFIGKRHSNIPFSPSTSKSDSGQRYTHPCSPVP